MPEYLFLIFNFLLGGMEFQIRHAPEVGSLSEADNPISALWP